MATSSMPSLLLSAAASAITARSPAASASRSLYSRIAPTDLARPESSRERRMNSFVSSPDARSASLMSVCRFSMASSCRETARESSPRRQHKGAVVDRAGWRNRTQTGDRGRTQDADTTAQRRIVKPRRRYLLSHQISQKISRVYGAPARCQELGCELRPRCGADGLRPATEPRRAGSSRAGFSVLWCAAEVPCCGVPPFSAGLFAASNVSSVQSPRRPRT